MSQAFKIKCKVDELNTRRLISLWLSSDKLIYKQSQVAWLPF